MDSRGWALVAGQKAQIGSKTIPRRVGGYQTPGLQGPELGQTKSSFRGIGGSKPPTGQAFNPHVSSFQLRGQGYGQQLRTYANTVGQPGSRNGSPATNPVPYSNARNQTVALRNIPSQVPKTSANPQMNNGPQSFPAAPQHNSHAPEALNRPSKDVLRDTVADHGGSKEAENVEEQPLALRRRPNTALYLPITVSLRNLCGPSLSVLYSGINSLANTRCAP